MHDITYITFRFIISTDIICSSPRISYGVIWVWGMISLYPKDFETYSD